MRSTIRGFALLTIAAATITATLAPSAAAARTGSPLGYALTAVGFRSYFVFDTRPRESVHGTLRIVGLTPGAKTILVRPVDVSTAAAGGLQYGNAGPSADGRWLTLAAKSVRLAGAESINVPFTVRVPADARSGDHFIGITAVDRRVFGRPATGHGPIRLRLIPRLAMTIQVRLPGPRTSALAAGASKIVVAPSGASVALAIANRGNTLIPGSTGTITISQGATPLFTHRIELAAFAPNTAITYESPWDGTPVQGTYRVTGEVRPAGAPTIVINRTVTFGRSAIRRYRADTARQAKEASGTSVGLIIALAAAVIAAVGFGVAYTLARQQIARTGKN
jgi:hypothetical protein